ncbi:hypothetical protein [Evansella tamaricis]|uniref:Lipoprotein n=1 Tax=Evansella tamaricis TaxID=2069301 RepID=A0ABS6JBV8_9BACI|nr:hypothetical protein [Evansella tamaricis]MBU9710332.1 hypothetical protein [Evansella tamaricis]
MNHRKYIYLICLVIFFANVIVGCGQKEEAVKEAETLPQQGVEEVLAGDREKLEEESDTLEDEVENGDTVDWETTPTTPEDIAGVWMGERDGLGIYFYENGRGDIAFSDNHERLYLHFVRYSENGTALELEIDTSLHWEEHDPFSILVKRSGTDTIEIMIGNVTKTYVRSSDEEVFPLNLNFEDERFGHRDQEATDRQVAHLEETLQTLSDNDILIGTVFNSFDYRNEVFTYLDYVGSSTDVETVRTAILNKVIEMNLLVDKYKWVNSFTVNTYLNHGVTGETERDKQVNALTPSREGNQGNQAFQISTDSEDRWILSKKRLSVDDLPGYVTHFGGVEPFLTKRDRDISRKYPLYEYQNMGPLTVLLESFVEGISSDVQEVLDENSQILEASYVKNIIGVWQHYPEELYYEITFDEFGGMIYNRQSGFGYGFTIREETDASIEISFSDQRWNIVREGDELKVTKSNGVEITLIKR